MHVRSRVHLPKVDPLAVTVDNRIRRYVQVRAGANPTLGLWYIEEFTCTTDGQETQFICHERHTAAWIDRRKVSLNHGRGKECEIYTPRDSKWDVGFRTLKANGGCLCYLPMLKIVSDVDDTEGRSQTILVN